MTPNGNKLVGNSVARLNSIGLQSSSQAVLKSFQNYRQYNKIRHLFEVVDFKRISGIPEKILSVVDLEFTRM